jgi:hypothetical protein
MASTRLRPVAHLCAPARPASSACGIEASTNTARAFALRVPGVLRGRGAELAVARQRALLDHGRCARIDYSRQQVCRIEDPASTPLTEVVGGYAVGRSSEWSKLAQRLRERLERKR